MPEIQIGDLKVKMTVEEFIEFLNKTDPAEMSKKLQALAQKPTEQKTATPL